AGWDSGIDRFLFAPELGGAGSLAPNRMAPNTALNFVFVGLALVTLNGEVRGGHRPSKYLVLLPLLLSLLALTGYAYGVRSFYGLSSYIPMALNTALTFLLISTGILLARPDRGLTRVFTSDDLGGSLARRLLPFAVGALLVLGWLRLQGERLGLYDAELGVSLTVFVSSMLMGAIIWTSAHSLSRADADRRRAADALRSAYDGLELRVQERTAQLTNANGALECEIAEREHAEAALRTSEEQLRQAQKMEAIGRLAGGVAHDFNNMLTAIIGYSQLIRLRMPPHDPAYGNTEEIEKAAARATSLTRQLLAFSRQQVLQARVLDLNVLIGEMDKMLRRLIGADIDLLTAPGPSLDRVKV
ncbi:MAG: histidine kinase dimerization/phospho-acceptor domain-containing protein, partial [Gemmatimonadota bacterium]